MMASILVVDDDASMVTTLCAVLRRKGYEAEGAASGEEAIERTANREWSAVVMDVRMPGMNGVAACRVLRDAHPGLPVILMTAHCKPELLAEAREAGVTRVLAKPFPIPELLGALSALAS